MRRFGDADSFLGLIEQVRARRPDAGIRTNVIVGFPGETKADLEVLSGFLVAARLDTVGVFGYSDEDGTEGASLEGHIDDDEVLARVEHVSRLVEELTAQRAEDRIGETVDVLVEQAGPDGVEGRAEHQAPDVDGTTSVRTDDDTVAVGDILRVTVVGSAGVDLVAVPVRQ
jgi:tRNA A37 methylthiotransferase MiaB